MANNLEYIKTASGTGVTTLTVADCFSTYYTNYYMAISKAKFSSNAYTWIRFMDSGGSLINASEYDNAMLDMYANAGFANLGGDNQSAIANFALAQSGVSDFGGIGVYIFSPFTSNFTYTIQRSTSFSSQGRATQGLGVHKSEEVLSGIQVNRSAGDAFDMTINMYGIK